MKTHLNGDIRAILLGLLTIVLLSTSGCRKKRHQKLSDEEIREKLITSPWHKRTYSGFMFAGSFSETHIIFHENGLYEEFILPGEINDTLPIPFISVSDSVRFEILESKLHFNNKPTYDSLQLDTIETSFLIGLSEIDLADDGSDLEILYFYRDKVKLDRPDYSEYLNTTEYRDDDNAFSIKRVTP